MGIAYVGSATSGVSSSGSSVTITYASTAGNTLVVFGANPNTAPTQVKDSNSTIWTLNTAVYGSIGIGGLAYIVNSPAISSVTVTFGGSGNNNYAILAEYSGVASLHGSPSGSTAGSTSTATYSESLSTSSDWMVAGAFCFATSLSVSSDIGNLRITQKGSGTSPSSGSMTIIDNTGGGSVTCAVTLGASGFTWQVGALDFVASAASSVVPAQGMPPFFMG